MIPMKKITKYNKRNSHSNKVAIIMINQSLKIGKFDNGLQIRGIEPIAFKFRSSKLPGDLFMTLRGIFSR